jgi:hypothetical protein
MSARYAVQRAFRGLADNRLEARLDGVDVRNA